MNKRIDVEAKNGQAHAHSELGNTKKHVEVCNNAEQWIQEKLDRVGMATKHILNNSNNKFTTVGNKLVLVVEDIDGLFEHELVGHYLTTKPEQLQRLQVVQNRAEFLLEYWNKIKTNEIIMSYPQEMVDNMDEFIQHYVA